MALKDTLWAINNELIRLGVERKSVRFVFGYEDDVERSPGEHGGEGAVAFADGEGVGGVIPGDCDAGELAFFVAVGLAVIFVEREVSVGARVDV